MPNSGQKYSLACTHGYVKHRACGGCCCCLAVPTLADACLYPVLGLADPGAALPLPSLPVSGRIPVTGVVEGSSRGGVLVSPVMPVMGRADPVKGRMSSSVKSIFER